MKWTSVGGSGSSLCVGLMSLLKEAAHAWEGHSPRSTQGKQLTGKAGRMERGRSWIPLRLLFLPYPGTCTQHRVVRGRKVITIAKYTVAFPLASALHLNPGTQGLD